MRFEHALLFLPEGRFARGSLTVEGGRLLAVTPGDETHVPGSTDLSGKMVLPGLIDLHLHGAAGADFSDGDYEGLVTLGRYLARRGITAFAPASMTLPAEQLERAYGTARRYGEKTPAGCARLAGIHMEGPFFCESKKGAQNGAYLRLPDAELVRRLWEISGGRIRLADVAPELPGAMDFIRQVSAFTRVSLAHTAADYDTAGRGFDAGATHLTHCFNAMEGLHHRRPGPIGAAAERGNVTVELIGDGIHIHPAMLRLAFTLFAGRICLISDSLRCCGMPEGRYELGGQQILLSGGAAYLSDGTLAGAASDLLTDLQNLLRFGIDPAEAITAATLTPARVLGCEGELGSLKAGKAADFLVLSPDYALQAVYLGGERLS